ncbi:MAG: c-type cytochrome [Sulfuritalea sp.]|nr:c-type cytochrome [Sulfuritalea sp.]
MYKLLTAAVSMALVSSFALAQASADKKSGIEIKDYPGNTPPTEKVATLKLKGDAKAGQADYKAYCEACHMPTGGGTPDGSIPQLAGQHSSVVIKQLADIRSGLRYNPTMYPFARKLPDPQAIANVAAYIGTLCIPLDSGKYQGPDAAKQVAEGKRLYEKECAQCHQPNGEGLKEMFYPVLAGQHYQYLLRQMTEIHDGKRVEVPPEMLKVITKYNNAQLAAISAYQASLTTPGSMLRSGGSMCKTASAKGGKT